MTARVIVFTAPEDQARVTAILAEAGHSDPLVVTLASERAPFRHGESLVALGVWSEAAARANAGAPLREALSLYARRSILCRLDDTPLEGAVATLDSSVVILAPTPNATLASLSSAIDLAGRRLAPNDEAAPVSPRRSVGTWILAAIGIALSAGLGVAGISAWNVDSELPPLIIDASQQETPRAAQVPTTGSPTSGVVATLAPAGPIANEIAEGASKSGLSTPAPTAIRPASSDAAPATRPEPRHTPAEPPPLAANEITSASTLPSTGNTAPPPVPPPAGEAPPETQEPPSQ